MIIKLIRYFARRSKDVTVQTVLASLSGLISTFGMTGTIAIILKLRKQQKPVHLAQRVKLILSIIINVVLFGQGTFAHFVPYRYFAISSAIFMVATLVLAIRRQRIRK